MSMTDYDIPNIQRLNLTPRDTEQENGDIVTAAAAVTRSAPPRHTE